MYNRLKSIFKQVIPKKSLFVLEGPIRGGIYLFYKGDEFQCNICNKELRTFIASDHDHKVCPYCGSIERNRRLWQLLDKADLKPNQSILHFSPSRSLYRKFKELHADNYESTDLSSDFMADTNMDITAIASKDEAYDIIICYHILEHVMDDQQAMNELYRVLKENGTCFIQTPFKDGDIYENESIVTESDRLRHFGQVDHVRVYSIAGLQQRLENSGFNVEVSCHSETKDNKYGFSAHECLLICTKKNEKRK